MEVAIRVKARLFARLREQAGVEAAALELAPEATVADAYEALRRAHPALEPDRRLIRPALNRAFTEWDAAVGDGDEIAFIPPVSGGVATPELIEITSEPLDPRRLEAAVTHPGAGAICTFTGIVRDNSRGQSVTHLDYEAFAEMAVPQMRHIGQEIKDRWPGARVAMAHRTGKLEVGEVSVVVCVSAPHREEAIAACKWGIDTLKESVPIWKKEHAADGTYWIEGDAAKPA